MLLLQGMNLTGLAVTYCRTEGEPVTGKIETGGVRGDGSLFIYWRRNDGLSRATRFLPSCWRCDVGGGVITLIRTAKNPDAGDVLSPYMPDPDMNLVTLVRLAD